MHPSRTSSGSCDHLRLGPDVRVLARESEDLPPQIAETGIARRGGLDVGIATEPRKPGQVVQILTDLEVLPGHLGFKLVHLLVVFLRDMRREQRLYAKRPGPSTEHELCHLHGLRRRAGLRQQSGKRRVHFREGLCGRPEGQAVRLDVGILDREAEQLAVDALELVEDLGELVERVFLLLGAALLEELPQLLLSLLHLRRLGARLRQGWRGDTMKAKPSIRDLAWMAVGAVPLLAVTAAVMLTSKGDSMVAKRLAFTAKRADLVDRMRLGIASASEAEKSAVLAVTERESLSYADHTLTTNVRSAWKFTKRSGKLWSRSGRRHCHSFCKAILHFEGRLVSRRTVNSAI
jgi:hypothetical protein